MTSYQFSVDEKEMAGAEFMAMVHQELQKAFLYEKKHNNISQQLVATKLGVNRSVVNRQIGGLENITSRSVGELLWALGWRPKFEAIRIEPGARGANIRPDEITTDARATEVVLEDPLLKPAQRSRSSANTDSAVFVLGAA
ncbi:MAG: hypothetical protein EKK41_22930 [Hyphomicrobiales bacterium]|nr:MAG: hypothetical protein EKK41_22930 [Hyphomicrobiales bacterium]